MAPDAPMADLSGVNMDKPSVNGLFLLLASSAVVGPGYP